MLIKLTEIATRPAFGVAPQPTTPKVDRINSNLKMMLCHHEYSFDASWRHRLSNHIQRLIHREEFDDALRYLRDM